jgi:hypothetical protein
VLRFLVALAPIRDLFLFAKHLFVAARGHIVTRHFALTTLLPIRKDFGLVHRSAVCQTVNGNEVWSNLQDLVCIIYDKVVGERFYINITRSGSR